MARGPALTIYHNPRCSKSREMLKLLRDRGIEPTIIEYLKTPPDETEIRLLLKKLRIKPIQMVRKGEKVWKTLGIADNARDDAVIAALVEHPVLIERPIVVRGSQARIGRPPEEAMVLV